MKLTQAKLVVGLLAGIGFSMAAVAADVMTTKDGLTVYTFDKDSGGKSACYQSCAQQWPAVTPEMMKGGVDSISRDDGGKQAALNGKPLYLFAGDKKAGDTVGDGMGGVWHVVPAGGKASSAPATSAPASSGYRY